MKAIDGALPVDCTYTLIDVSYSHKDDDDYFPQACDNCGKMITQKAHVRNDKGNAFTIGLDCAKAILSIKNPMVLYETEKQLRSEVKFKRFLKTKCTHAVISNNTLYLYEKPVTKWSPMYRYRANPDNYLKYLPKHVILIS